MNIYSVIKKYFLIFLVIIVIFVVFLNTISQKSVVLTINKRKLTAAVANSFSQKEVGLSKIKSLSFDSGMVFPMGKKEYYRFWMKEMLFPIDIIWIDGNRIVDITQNVQPENKPPLTIYTPKKPVNYVLEVNSGYTKRYNIKIGDLVFGLP